MESNYYEVLGVKSSAKDEEIKHAFKSLAKIYHPDKNPGNKSYEEQFKKINEAYQVLSDNSKRFFYDIKLESRSSPHAAEAAPTPPPFKQSTRGQAGGTKKQVQFMEKKVWVYTGGGILLFIAGAFFLYGFMNQYAAKNLFEEGYALENEKVYIGAMEKYSEAIGYDKTLADAYTRRALLRTRCLGDFNGGLYDLKQAILYAKAPSGLLYYYHGKVLKRLEKYDDAMKDFDKAISIDARLDSAYFAKAEIENAVQKNYSLAILHYGKALAINPGFAKAYFGRGIARQHIKSNREALEDFNKAIDLSDKEASWYYYRGLSKVSLKRKRQACEDFTLAVSKGYEAAEKEKRKYCR